MLRADPTPPFAQLPDADVIRATAREVVSRPEYRLDAPPEGDTRLLDLILDVLTWLATPLRSLFDWLDGISPALAWVVTIALMLILCGLLAHIIYSIRVAVRGDRRGGVFRGDERLHFVDPHVLERRSAEAAAAGDYIAAVRLLFRACLARLEQAEGRTFRLGVTNREHLRRYRNAPVCEPLGVFVETIDAKWYGQGVCVAEDYQRCADAGGHIRRLSKEVARADRP